MHSKGIKIHFVWELVFFYIVIGVCHTNWLDIISTIEQRLKLNASFMVKDCFIKHFYKWRSVEFTKNDHFLFLFVVNQLKAIFWSNVNFFVVFDLRVFGRCHSINVIVCPKSDNMHGFNAFFSVPKSLGFFWLPNIRFSHYADRIHYTLNQHKMFLGFYAHL